MLPRPAFHREDRYLVLDQDFVYLDLKIEKGYRWDGCSIPQPLRHELGEKFEIGYVLPSLVHDFVYETRVRSRLWADRHFYHLLRLHGVTMRRTLLFYCSVRVFGIFAWYRLVRR